MNELSKLLQENLNIEFISATLSNPKNKDGVQKVKVRPILKKDVLYFQLESFRNNQAFHENVEEKKACEILLKYMENMRQMQMETQRAAYTILVSKKGKVTIKSKMKKGEKKQINMSHDRKKKYVLEEGVPVPFSSGSWCYDTGWKDRACEIRQIPADQPVPGIYRGYIAGA